MLRTIDGKKSEWWDRISNKFLKIAVDVVGPSLTVILTASIRTGIFPSEWNQSRVLSVFTNGGKTNLDNNRPTPVITVVSEIFEKITFEKQYLNENNLLIPCQSGFALFIVIQQQYLKLQIADL